VAMFASYWGKPLDQGQQATFVRCGFALLTNTIALVLALRAVRNLWMIYVFTPIAAALALWALASWQRTALAALWFRLLIPLLGVAWVAIVLTIEDMQTFSLLAEPFAGLLVLGAAIYTLVARTIMDLSRPMRSAWFWIGIGLAISSAGSIALPPAANWLIRRHPELVMRAYEIKAILEAAAYAAIAWGMTCRSPVGGEREAVFAMRRE